MSRDKSKPKRSQRTTATVVLVLFVLLGMSVILGQWQKRKVGQKQEVRAVLERARAKKEEGEALLELNPAKAREFLLKAQEILQELEELEFPPQNLVDFRNELESTLAKVLHEHQVEPKTFFDLELIKAGAKGDDWDFSAGKIVILDRDKTTAYSLGLSDKQSAILAGGEELAGAEQIAAFLPRVFTLTRDGIFESNQEVKSQKLIIENDEEWQKLVDFRAFGGSLYLLEKGGRIWKYSASESGFGAKQAWLENESDSLLKAISMAIDGNVWVLNSEGKIFKYVRGVRDVFGVAGLDKSLLDPAAIYTDADQEKIYILDRGNSRVVVLAKSGEYNSQYLWEGLGEVADLVASEEEKKIFLLVGSKVYEIGMR